MPAEHAGQSTLSSQNLVGYRSVLNPSWVIPKVFHLFSIPYNSVCFKPPDCLGLKTV